LIRSKPKISITFIAILRPLLPVLYQFVFLFLLQFLNRLIWFAGNAYWLQPLGLKAYLHAFLVGCYFDLPVMAYVFAPLWLWWAIAPSSVNQKNIVFRILATALAICTLLFNAIDAGYSKVTSKRSGKELLDVLLDPANEISNYLLDYWWGLLLILFSSMLVWRFFPMPLPIQANRQRGRFRWPLGLKSSVALVLRLGIAGFCILVIGRGGSRLRPLQASDASEYVLPEISPLVVSTPFSLISSFQTQGLKSVEWCSKQQLDSMVLGNSIPCSKWTALPSGTAPKNLVVIVVESLARDYTGFLNGAPYTPFLDQLAKNPDAVTLPYCFANGTKSIEMAPSIFAGMPSLMEDFFITSSYSTNRFTNAFGLFGRWGYSTSFFHGSNNGTMGFQSFFKNGGLQQYFGINEYPNTQRDFDGHWGIFDEPYLQHFCKEVSAMKTPFFTSVFTLSSHHPYSLPPNLQIKLPGSEKTVQKTIAYADYSLQQFFKSASQQPWFNNTLFVITGDHTSHGTLEYFYSPSGHYEVPVLYYFPGNGESLKSKLDINVSNKTCSQLDLIPTAVSILQDKPAIRLGMGRSILDTSYNGFSYHMDKGLFYILQYPYVLVMNTQGECLEFYSQIRNSNRKTNLIGSKDVTLLRQKGKMHVAIKAAVQSYRNALINNRWDTEFN